VPVKARGDFEKEKQGASYNETELPEHHKFNETGNGHPKNGQDNKIWNDAEDFKHDQGIKTPEVLTG
jgi:hypothetical protein